MSGAGDDPGSRAQLGNCSQGRRFFDATSGNTGIAYAMIARRLDYRVKLVPSGQRERRAQKDSGGLWRGDRDHARR